MAVSSRVPKRDERVLVVWSYNLDSIIPTCRDFEEKLIKLVWTHRSTNVSIASLNLASSNTSSDANLTEKLKAVAESKEVPTTTEAQPAGRSNAPKKSRFWGLAYWVTDKGDIEKTAEGPSPRPIRLLAPAYNGLGVAMSICEFNPYIESDSF